MKRSCLLSLIGILGFLSSLSAQVRTEMWLEKGGNSPGKTIPKLFKRLSMTVNGSR